MAEIGMIIANFEREGTMSDLSTSTIMHRSLAPAGASQNIQPSMKEVSVSPTPFNLPDGGGEGEHKF